MALAKSSDAVTLPEASMTAGVLFEKYFGAFQHPFEYIATLANKAPTQAPKEPLLFLSDSEYERISQKKQTLWDKNMIAIYEHVQEQLSVEDPLEVNPRKVIGAAFMSVYGSYDNWKKNYDSRLKELRKDFSKIWTEKILDERRDPFMFGMALDLTQKDAARKISPLYH